MELTGSRLPLLDCAPADRLKSMDAAAIPALTALGDPTRARIIELIRQSDGGRALVGRLASELRLRQPTVSHHMSVLSAEGLVLREPDGRRAWYSLNPEHENRINAVLGAPIEVSDTAADFERIVNDLGDRFRGVFSRETVERCLVESRELLAVRDGTRLLASRASAFAALRLEDLARSESRSEGLPEVLFVCVQNAGRSQLAAGILRQLAGARVIVRTAGSEPAQEVRTSIVTALDEIGVHLGGEFPKPLTDEAVRAADVVITMGCGDACPIYPGRRYLDWDVEDPAGKSLAVVRHIRDDIDARVRELLPELIGA